MAQANIVLACATLTLPLCPGRIQAYGYPCLVNTVPSQLCKRLDKAPPDGIVQVLGMEFTLSELKMEIGEQRWDGGEGVDGATWYWNPCLGFMQEFGGGGGGNCLYDL